jgi:hypothetical protein
MKYSLVSFEKSLELRIVNMAIMFWSSVIGACAKLKTLEPPPMTYGGSNFKRPQGHKLQRNNKNN